MARHKGKQFWSVHVVEAGRSTTSKAAYCRRQGLDYNTFLRWSRRLDEAVAAYRQEYPARLQFPYGLPKYEKPFLVRSMWHDGEFTYVKTDATELPALYEMKDGKPSIVNFQVRQGTYVVPKVLDRGYLALGNQRFSFEQQGR